MDLKLVFLFLALLVSLSNARPKLKVNEDDDESLLVPLPSEFPSEKGTGYTCQGLRWIRCTKRLRRKARKAVEVDIPFISES